MSACDICGGYRFLHFDDPHEIQRCDECWKDGSDIEAVFEHRKLCGCKWPEEDFQHKVRRRSFFGPGSGVWIHHSLLSYMHQINKLARDREAFTGNLAQMVIISGEMLEACNALLANEDVKLVADTCTMVENLTIVILRAHASFQRGRWIPDAPEGYIPKPKFPPIGAKHEDSHPNAQQ